MKFSDVKQEVIGNGFSGTADCVNVWTLLRPLDHKYFCVCVCTQVKRCVFVRDGNRGRQSAHIICMCVHGEDRFTLKLNEILICFEFLAEQRLKSNIESG